MELHLSGAFLVQLLTAAITVGGVFASVRSESKATRERLDHIDEKMDAFDTVVTTVAVQGAHLAELTRRIDKVEKKLEDA